MSKVYFCKIDNTSFSNKNDLVKHLLNNYTIEEVKKTESIDVFGKLQNSFPFAKIDVRELAEEDKYGDYHVNMYWKKYDAQFSFYIGESSDSSYYEYHFDSVGDAILHYNNFLTAKEEIITMLTSRYPISNLTIGQMYDGDNTADGILFNFNVGSAEYGVHFEFDRTIDEFVNSFKVYFEDVVEGSVDYETDYSGKEYIVDGTPVSVLFERAKKVRVEIIEEKDF